MRPLEIVLLVALAPVVVGAFVARRRRPGWWPRIMMLPTLVTVAQLLLEGYRWQMAPAYALAVVVLAVGVARARQSVDGPAASRLRRVLKFSAAAVGALVFAVAATLPTVFPVFRLPVPTGTHAIGFTRFALVDSARAETFSADPADRRAVVVEAWYPAESPSARRAPFWGPHDQILPRLGPALGLPAFLFTHLRHVRANSYVDAQPVASATPFPVLLFSHGFNQGFPGQNTPQMEELASHGYAVFSIAHPHEGLAAAYPDGGVVTVSKSRMDSIGKGMRTSAQALRRFAASRDRAERDSLFRQAIAEPKLLHESLRVWTEDTRFVMDALARMTAGRERPAGATVFAGRLDTTRVGVFGMSFGGTTAGQVCVVEPRCKAGVNLDGTQYGDPIDVPLRVPFMFMHSAIAGLNDPVYHRAAGPAYSVNVRGSTHFNYTDFTLISPLFKRMGFLGPIEGMRMERIMNDYLLAFFDTHLRGERGQRTALLDSTESVYPEVQVSSRTP